MSKQDGRKSSHPSNKPFGDHGHKIASPQKQSHLPLGGHISSHPKGRHGQPPSNHPSTYHQGNQNGTNLISTLPKLPLPKYDAMDSGRFVILT